MKFAFCVAVLAFCLAVGQAARSGFDYEARHPHNGNHSLRLIGNVNDVLAGLVTPSFANDIWPAPAIGFGAGTVGPINATGELFFANNYAFVRSTDNSSVDYYQTVSSEVARTPFSVVMPNHLQPDGIVTIRSSAQSALLSLEDVYDELTSTLHGIPACFWGFVDFAEMDAIAAAKAPVWGESLLGPLKAQYYSKPVFHLTNVHALLFACMANYSAFNDAALAARLSEALYYNPFDQSSAMAMQSHAHVITLDAGIDSLHDVHPANVTGVYHLLTTSTISSMKARVYKIDSVNKLTPILSPPCGARGY
jgi:hypothetical protein